MLIFDSYQLLTTKPSDFSNQSLTQLVPNTGQRSLSLRNILIKHMQQHAAPVFFAECC